MRVQRYCITFFTFVKIIRVSSGVSFAVYVPRRRYSYTRRVQQQLRISVRYHKVLDPERLLERNPISCVRADHTEYVKSIVYM